MPESNLIDRNGLLRFKFQAGNSPEDELTADRLNALVQACNRAQLMNVMGGTFRAGPGGTFIEVNVPAPAANPTFALQTLNASTVVDGSPVYQVQTTLGTINGQIPTIDGTPLDGDLTSAPNLSVSPTDLWVYVETDWTTGAMNDAPQILAGATVPTTDVDLSGTGSGYRTIAQLTWTAGKLTLVTPTIFYSMSAYTCTGTVVFNCGS